MYASPMYMGILISCVCSEYHFLMVTTQLQSIMKAIYESGVSGASGGVRGIRGLHVKIEDGLLQRTLENSRQSIADNRT